MTQELLNPTGTLPCGETHADGPNGRGEHYAYSCDGGFTQTWNTVGAGKNPTPRELNLEERMAPQ